MDDVKNNADAAPPSHHPSSIIHHPSLPDRGHLATEQRLTASAAIDALQIEQALQVINRQDLDVPVVVREQIPKIAALVGDVVANMRQGGRLIYVGAGTSGRLGVLDASECPPTFCSDPSQVVGVIAGGDAALRKSSEGAEDDEAAGAGAIRSLQLTALDSVIGIAAGGTTPYVWGALREAEKVGALTALVTCVPIRSLMIRHRAPVVPPNQPVTAPPPPALPVPIDHGIELVVGPEVVTGSTRMKAGTATKLALNMISTATMIQLGKAWGNLMIDLRATNAKLRDRAIRILTSQTDLSRHDAAALLDRADGRVKLALIMAIKNVDRGQAQRLLDEHAQQLRPILGPPR